LSRFASCTLGERRFAALVDGDAVRPLDSIAELGRETPAEVLADPPLTESMVRRYTDLMAFLYDLPMGAAQRQKLRDFVVGYWKSGDRPQMKAVLDFLRVEEAFAGRTADERRFARYQIFPELLKEAKKQQKGDPETAWLLSLYAAAHPPLAGGDPPLTREITDACAEAICFMAGEGRGEHIAATPEFKNEVAGAIAGRYAGISPEARKQLAQMPMRWLQLRASWPAYAAADRERLRAFERRERRPGERTTKADRRERRALSVRAKSARKVPVPPAPADARRLYARLSRVIDEPAAMYAPSPTRTGAISCESLPMNAPSSITVGCLCTPS